MDLNKILVTTGLSLFLLGSNFSKAFSEEIKENEKYQTLFLANYGDGGISLEWDTNHDGKEDLSGFYRMTPIVGLEGFFDLDWVGKKSNEGNEIRDEKYSRILLRINNGGLVIGWYKEIIDAIPNKQYYYKRLGFDEKNRGIHRLEAIQDNTNKNEKFEDFEFIYQSENFKKMLENKTKN